MIVHNVDQEITDIPVLDSKHTQAWILLPNQTSFGPWLNLHT